MDTEKPPSLFRSLETICIDTILENKLVDDYKLLEHAADATIADFTEINILNKVHKTFGDLSPELQAKVLDRAVELGILDDFWLGYFIPLINESGVLNARGSKLTDAGIELLVSACPTLVSLDLSFCRSITNKGFKLLVDLTELVDLHMEFTNIKSDGLRELERLSGLENVNIKGCVWLNYPVVTSFIRALDNLKVITHDSHQTQVSSVDLGFAAPDLEYADVDIEDEYQRHLEKLQHFRGWLDQNELLE